MDTWSNLCRSCLSSNTTVSLLGADESILLKFYDITTIEVSAEDGLPQKLCGDCYSLLTSAHQFRKQCIKMDTDLKLQLQALLEQAKDQYSQEADMDDINQEDDDDDIANDPVKQLEAIIKKEPSDSDDDCYYVLVIDDPKDKENENENIIPDKSVAPDKPDFETTIDMSHIKSELIDPVPAENEQPIEPLEEFNQTHNQFENTIDSFLVSNTKIPVNVPATILENEEESQDNDDYNNVMDTDTQDSNSQDQGLQEIHDDQSQMEIQTYTGNIVSNLPNSKNFIKILTTANADGTIVLKGTDGIEYLTDSQLVRSADGDQMDQEEVIFCEGDDSSPFQILKCEGSELVIEYAQVEDGQIATVLQQEDGTFLCDCGEQFEDLAEYEKHRYKHNPAGEHLCNLCGKGFESAQILTGHTLLHSVTGMLLLCPFCNQPIRRNALTQHIKYAHNNIKPKCSICFKTFANPNNLKRHMMIHSGIREFECDICHKRFHQKISMQTHRLTHMNPYSCNQCDETFENKEALATHKDDGSCDKSKITKVKTELLKTVKQEITTNIGKVVGYACSLCKKMFSLESALEQHVESTHMIDPTELICSECGEVLPSKKEKLSHILIHKNAKNKTVKRFECSICGKGCSSQAMLIMHERVHTNERPYPCQLCSLRFKTKTHLRTHQLTHTREKKFGCSVCMKFFALKGNLVVHLRTHTGERPYICSICGEAFIDSKYLKKHKLRKHAIENVPWNKY
ncbi:oocyte zinc finger protein XlCOF6-like [Ostrinia furnacalis]|uniref:oocyte zinc finger protein XlCOF6-like n=1 Tax=Ostrinia furnacalis TaxID=93504 RepID=UPI001038DF7F|nr:oocyte zinc finger protein XlCOF6-like [Ostrinia furnacalis]